MVNWISSFGDVESEEGEDGWDEAGGNDHKLVEGSDFKMAYLWVEGWRSRLRAGGDVVERSRYGDDDDGPGLQRLRRLSRGL